MENLKSSPQKGLALLVLTGASLGALVGLYVGMSTSPIVSTIIGTLTSLLTTLVGLKVVLDKKDTPEEGEEFDSFKIKMVLLSSFALACILFTLSGMYFRTHSTFSPSLSEKSSSWEKAGFSKEEIKKILLFQELGIQTGKDGLNEGIIAVSALTESSKAQASVLFSAEVDVSACELLSNVSAEQSLNVILDNYTTNGGIWEKWALAIDQQLPKEHKKQALLTLKESICAGQSFVISDRDCESLSALKTASTEKEVKKALNGGKAFWQTLYERSEPAFKGNEEVRIQFIKTIASTVCN